MGLGYKRSLISTSMIMTIALALLMIPLMVNIAKAQVPLKIGVVTSRSGALIYYGEMEINGLHLGIEYATGGTFEVSGRPIQILVEDDAGSPTTAAAAARKLVETDMVDILQGSGSSACASAVQAVAEEKKVIFMVAPAAAASITGSGFTMHTFRTASSTWHDALTGGKYALTIGKKIAFLAPDYSWGWDTVKSWSKVILDGGGEVIHVEYVPFGTIDFRPYLERIITAKPEVFVPAWAGYGSVQLFQQIAELNMYALMTVTSGIGDLWSLQTLGPAIVGYTGMIKYGYTLPVNTVNDWLVTRWRQRYDAKTLFIMSAYTLPVPDLFVDSGFAAGQAIVEAVKKSGGSTAAADLIPILQGLTFTSPKGTMTIRDVDHQALQEMYIARVVNDTTIPEFPKGFLRPEWVKTLTPGETAPPITPNADINKDKVINIVDKWIMSANTGPLFTPTNPNYNARADINHDNRVNVVDKWHLNSVWGETWE